MLFHCLSFPWCVHCFPWFPIVVRESGGVSCRIRGGGDPPSLSLPLGECPREGVGGATCGAYRVRGAEWVVQSTGRGRGTSKKRWDNHHVDSAKSGAATRHGSAMPPPWKSVVRNPGGANLGLFTTQDFGVGAPGEAGGVRWGNLCLGIRLPISLDHPPILSLPSDARVPPLWGDASRHSGGMVGRHQIRRGVGRRWRVGRAGGYRGVPDTDKPERKRTLL